jgi:peroxiredoxin Q/BCP
MPLLNTGDVAPDFVATAHTGQTVRLSDYRGRNVVLWFYPKADTPG